MARPIGRQTIVGKGLSPVARRIVESLEEYANYRRGEKTDIEMVRVTSKVPERST